MDNSEERPEKDQDFARFLSDRKPVEEGLALVRLRGRLLRTDSEDRFAIAPWGGKAVLEARTSDVVEFSELEGADRDLVEIALPPDADVRQVVITSAGDIGSTDSAAWAGYAAWKEVPAWAGYAAWKEVPAWAGYAAWW